MTTNKKVRLFKVSKTDGHGHWDERYPAKSKAALEQRLARDPHVVINEVQFEKWEAFYPQPNEDRDGVEFVGVTTGIRFNSAVPGQEGPADFLRDSYPGQVANVEAYNNDPDMR